jgi:hypothetical protein
MRPMRSYLKIWDKKSLSIKISSISREKNGKLELQIGIIVLIKYRK